MPNLRHDVRTFRASAAAAALLAFGLAGCGSGGALAVEGGESDDPAGTKAARISASPIANAPVSQDLTASSEAPRAR